MAELEAWDHVLERATATLVGLTGGRSGAAVLRSAAWEARFRADRRSVTVQLNSPSRMQPPRLNDYQLVLIYAADYEVPDGASPAFFAKTLTLHEGFQWDEQSLREVVLEVLGIFRYVLGHEPTAVKFADESRPPVLKVGRALAQRRR